MNSTIIIILSIGIISMYIIFNLLGFSLGKVKVIHSTLRSSKNCGIDGAKRTVSELIEKAKSEILIVSGHLSPACWNSKEVSDALLKAIYERSVHCSIISGPDSDINALLNLKPAILDKNIQIIVFKTPIKGHFIVVDRRHVRLEELDDSNNPNHTAEIYWDSPAIGTKMAKVFNDMIKKQKKIGIKTTNFSGTIKTIEKVGEITR